MVKKKKLQQFSDIATQYAKDVVDKKILTSKWTIAACQRHLNDLESAKSKTYLFKLDEAAANRACSFISKMPHIKGKWAGKPIHLEPWQVFIVCSVFGWLYRSTGLRRFRTVYIEVPRKNAKSTLSSAIGLYMAFMDGEGGAEVYSAATTRDQARIVFKDAQAMARKSQRFRTTQRVQVLAHNINQESSSSKFEALSAEGNSLDGLNVHCGVIDELHAHKTREVYDVIETATGAREQSLLWLITTAGSNRAGICYEQRTYLTKILDLVHEDDSYFGIIYTIDDDDDWTDPSIWEKANPNYGVSVFPEDIERLCRKARQMPSAVNNFLTKRLNVWVNADTAWMDMRAWDRCKDESLVPEDFEGEECVASVDLSSKIDIAVKLKLFKRGETYYMFASYYLPEQRIEESGNSQYEGWEIAGQLTATPGNVIDYDYIEQDLLDDSSMFEILEVPYDPFQATQFSTRMMAEGFEMVEMRPTVLNFSEPMKELEALVLKQNMKHNGDPIMAWMISNVVCHTDVKDNIYPRKERPENKIDGVIALIMALGRMMMREDKTMIYNKRGMRTV